MSVVSVNARSFILALFIRDDGERFLLGDNGFDFKDSQLHFSANTIENDEVAKQGVDGVMLAGQVRRASVQSFDGYIGDATMFKEEIEQMRRDFIAFFAKGYYFRVVYIDCNRNAWQRKGGYLVDAPEVKELWQIHPEYHVGLNFEDVNYYEYDENAEGEEILSNIISVPISSDVEGGLVWDENGAVSEQAVIEYDTETASASGNPISIADAVQAPLKNLEIQGNTTQQTYTGKNLFNLATPGTNNGVTVTANADGSFTLNGTTTGTAIFNFILPALKPAGTYTISCTSKNQVMDGGFFVRARNQNMGMLVPGGADGPSQIKGDGTNYAEKTFISTAPMYCLALNLTTTGVTYNNMIIYPQVEAGGTATDWERYVGGIPAPNPDYPQAVKVVTGENTLTISDGTNTQSYEINLGKNLFDIAAASDVWINTSGVAQPNAYWKNSDFIKVDPNTTYTLSGSTIEGGFPTKQFQWHEYSSDNESSYINQYRQANNVNSVTFTTHTGCNYIRVGYRIDALKDVQLELGSTPTSYAAYFAPIELCKIGDYQDSIYKSGGKWYVRKEVGKLVQNGTETGWYNLSGSTSYARTNAATSFVKNVPFFANRGLTTPTSGTRIKIPNNNLYWYETGYESIEAFKSSLATTNLIVYAPLLTPTDTEITNGTLVAQLEAILSQGYTYAGTNNITTVIAAGSDQGELEITYYTKYDAKLVSGGYVWEAGGSGGPTVVINESISAVSPVWTVFGPALNPILENTTTGEQIQYVGMVGEGQTLVVDMGEQTARLDGLNVISNIVGDYLTLAPGSNTLLFSAESDAPASEIGWSEIVG